MLTRTRTTEGVRISVTTEFRGILREEGEESSGFLFAYHISVENQNPFTVQLLRRHWVITDAFARVQEVKGEGVVGETPVIAPGEAYEYSSGCDLDTDMGTMRGAYEMQRRDDGRMFRVEIPEFSLEAPSRLN